jgi:hypothetical protein
MQDQSDRGAGFLGMVVTTLKTTIWTGKHHLGHGVSKSVRLRPPMSLARALTARTNTGYNSTSV